MNEIKVQVVKYPDRKALVLRYKCPLTGRLKTKSAETSVHRLAVKEAGKWESELREGRYHAPCKTTWAEFRERYETEVLPGLADGTASQVGSILDSVETILEPNLLHVVNEQRISTYQAKLRENGKAESTIKKHLAHLKAALRWAERVGMLVKAPRITMPKRAKASKGTDPMKGRPITTEEYERMLDKAAAVVKGRAESWKRYLTGLWLSGLRLGESLELSWDQHTKLSIDLDGKYPMLRIRAEAEKGNKDRLLPLAPDFAQWLRATPESQRKGFVLNPLDGNGKRAGAFNVSRTVTAIGTKAGVKVNVDAAGTVKYASAHDLRRSFGERWATKVMPQVLQQLMRHETIDTTLRFYVGRNAETMARALWEAHEPPKGNKSGNSEVDVCSAEST